MERDKTHLLFDGAADETTSAGFIHEAPAGQPVDINNVNIDTLCHITQRVGVEKARELFAGGDEFNFVQLFFRHAKPEDAKRVAELLEMDPLFVEETILMHRDVMKAAQMGFQELADMIGLDPAEDYIGQDLSGLDFHKVDLTGYNFKEVRFRNASFLGCRNLDKVMSMEGADITGAAVTGEQFKIMREKGVVGTPDVAPQETDFKGPSKGRPGLNA